MLAYMLFRITILTNRNKRLAIDVIQAHADNQLLQQNINTISDIEKAASDSDFIKFLSESREFAFAYIEGVQGAINAFKHATESNDANATNDTYQALLSFMPEEQTGMIK